METFEQAYDELIPMKMHCFRYSEWNYHWGRSAPVVIVFTHNNMVYRVNPETMLGRRFLGPQVLHEEIVVNEEDLIKMGTIAELVVKGMEFYRNLV